MKGSSTNVFQARDWAIGLVVTGLAFTLRFLGVRFGLPWFHHWDEGWITDNAAHMLQSRNWEPRIYQYGAPLPMLIGLSLRALSRLWPNSLFDSNDSVLLHWIGRVITVVISTVGAFATYITARYATVGDRGAQPRATYAAILYATSAELIAQGRYAVTDACLVSLVVCALACGALFLRGTKLLWGALALLFAAFAVAFKVTAATTIIIPLMLFAWRPVKSKRAWVGTLLFVIPASAVVFFALNPHVLIHWPTASSDISVRINQYREGRVPEFIVRRAGFDHLFTVGDAVVFQVFHRWRAASAVIAGLSFVGLVVAFRQRSRICVIGVVHACLVVAGLAFGSRAFLLRNYLVAVPILCIGFGFAMERVRLPILRRTLALAFGIVFVAAPAVQAFRTQQQAMDTRVAAIDWIAEHAKGASTSVAFTPEVSVNATGDRPELREVLRRPHIVQTKDVNDATQVERRQPDFVLVVSHPDFFGRGDIWPFRDVRGYRAVAEFDANPYEHNFDVTPTWMGRFNSLVLERQRE